MTTVSAAAGMAALGLLAGCRSSDAVQARQEADKPLYRVFEQVNKLESSDKGECMRLFDHNLDGNGMKTAMARLNLKAGAELKARTTTSPEIVYVISGSGMIKVNEVAYVLRDNSGIYIPAGFQMQLTNNSSKDLNCLIMAHSLPWLEGQKMPQPLTFDKNAPKMGESKTYDEIVGTKPQSLAPEKLETTTLTPSEAKGKP